MSKGKPTVWWYLVPLIFGIIGGVISYYAIKKQDKEFANALLVVGILITALSLIGRFMFPLQAMFT